jgi:pyridine nucleotide-disulfide oxidoreductase
MAGGTTPRSVDTRPHCGAARDGMVEAGVVAIDLEATVESVADSMAPHPTLSEAIRGAGLVSSRWGAPSMFPTEGRLPVR